MEALHLDPPVSSLRVLVAEDDDDLRSLLIDTLAREGHQVVELEDGFELGDYVEVSKRSISGLIRPDLIITDVRMPGHSGIEAARKARDSGLTCPIIVVSAFVDPTVREEAEELGGTTVLAKPIDVEAIAEMVAKVARE